MGRPELGALIGHNADMTMQPSPAPRQGMKRFGIGVLLAGLLLGIAGVIALVIAIVVIVKQTSGPTMDTPVDRAMSFEHGRYDIYVLDPDARQIRTGPSSSRVVPGPAASNLSPSDVRITAPDGSEVPVDRVSSLDTVVKGPRIYVAALTFDAAAKGTYQVQIAPERETTVMVARASVTNWVFFAAIGAILLGGALFMVGLVILVIRAVGNRSVRLPVAVPAAAMMAPPGWYPNPDDPSGSGPRWWDGQRWAPAAPVAPAAPPAAQPLGQPGDHDANQARPDV